MYSFIKHLPINMKSISQTLLVLVVFVISSMAITSCSKQESPSNSSTMEIKTETADKIEGLLWPAREPIRPFALFDQNEEDFSQNNFKNKWSFVSFGYTNCPDVCSVILTRYKAVKQILTEKGENIEDIQFVFVSVDPDRDTSDRLKEYLAYFDLSFIGISGRLSALDIITKEFFTSYVIPEHSFSEFYTVTHSSAIYLIDPMGRMSSVYTLPHDNEEITQRYLKIRSFIEGQKPE